MVTAELPVHPIDVLILAGIAWSASIAYTRGLMREGAAILTVFVALLGAAFGFPLIKPLLADTVEIPILSTAITLIALFGLLLLGARRAFRDVQQKAAETPLTPLDQAMGFGFGLLRGIVVACFAYMVLNWAVPYEKQPKWLSQYQSRPLLQAGAEALAYTVPKTTQKGVSADVTAMRQFGVDIASAVERMAEPTSSSSGRDTADSRPAKSNHSSN